MEKQYENDTVRLIAEKDFTKEDIANISVLQSYSLNACDALMTDESASWFTQTKDSLKEIVPYGRMRFLEVVEEYNQAHEKNFDTIYSQVFEVAKKKAPNITQPFDMIVTYEEQTQTLRKPITVKYNGWKLAHFEKQYIWNAGTFGYVTYTNWDYCLGDDGELYHVTTSYTRYNENSTGPADYSCSVRKVIPFDNRLLPNQNQHLFVAIAHGLICVMDEVAIGGSKGCCHDNGQARYIFNFSPRPNPEEYAYRRWGEGTIARINNLK